MRYFLGVDVGNTKSHALIADECGNCTGFGSAGVGSWERIGWPKAQQILHLIVEQAIAQAGIIKADIAGAGLGFAGYDWPEDRRGHVAMVDSLGLSKARYAIGNDTLMALIAGAEKGWGVVVVAGTSNNCRGRDRYGREGRIGGGGSRFAEFGGAAEIISQAIQAVALAWTQRGPATKLSEFFVAETGAADVADLLAGLVRGRYQLPPVLAPHVFEIAGQGDLVCREIIEWAGRELGSLAIGVIHQLKLQNETFDVVLSGSLYRGGEPLVRPMRQSIEAVAPGARLVHLSTSSAVGGVLLAMEQAGLLTLPMRPLLLESAGLIIGSEQLPPKPDAIEAEY